MRNTLTEESILLASVVKWIVLASITGALVGLAATGFLSVLGWAIEKADAYPYIFLFLPAAFFVSSFLTSLAPDAKGHGTEKVIEAIHQRSSNIPVAVVPIKLIATVITLAIGGSAGKEGPCAQIGAGVASSFARVLRFDENARRKLVICGISAGFATVFGTPIAGAIFGVEVLFVGAILYDVLLPSFIAGITAYQVSAYFGIPYLHLPPFITPPINEAILLRVIAAGIIFGGFSILLIFGLRAGKRLFEKITPNEPLKALIGGTMLVLLTLGCGREYLGLGLPTIKTCLSGQDASWYIPLLKILATSITLNCGGSGGIVTPIFFVGCSAGALIAGWFHLSVAMMAAIGFVSLLAGAANTPIAASIMAVEMFGPAIGPYAAVACIVSYLITGHRSVYSSQIMMVKKSASLNVTPGQEMRRVITAAPYKEKRRLLNLRNFLRGKR